ncbi:ABC transporter substrate-binding protein [Paenibacillus sp. J5C_2022]|nr:ABC transporter substrate-binding protein [Paenibacillus sp. J5C2022]
MKTRRLLLWAALLVCMVLVVSGCGAEGNENVAGSNGGDVQKQEDAPGNEVNEQDDSKQENESGDVRIYESINGAIELPANPERVLLAVQDYVGDVLVLGVKPIGVAGWISETSPYHKELIKDIENVGENREVSAEKVIALDPDVILTYDQNSYEELSKIAPTIVIPLEYGYEQRVTEIGKVLNKEAEAEKWIDGFQQKGAEKKEELLKAIGADEKVAIVELSAKEIYLMGKTYGRGGQIIYEVLGLHAPAKVEELAFEAGWAGISQESIPEVLGEADHIFLGVRNDASEMESQIMNSKLWQNLPAVQNGKVYPYSVDAFYYSDAIALEHQFDQIVSELISQ